MSESATGSDPFRMACHRVADWVADYFEHLDELPVSPGCAEATVASRLPVTAPRRGRELGALLDEFESVIVPSLSHWNHPRFFAYFNSSTSEAALLAEVLATALNPNAMTWESCPGAVELEEVMVQWIRGAVGLPSSFSGLLFEGGSTSTLHALAAAVHSRRPGSRELGVRADSCRPVVFASEEAHSSVEKALVGLGLGTDSLCEVPVDSLFKMDPAALEALVRKVRDAGHEPLAVVATLGSTSCTSIDPIPEIAAVCRRHRLWLHVDAAHGGALGLLPEARPLLAGWELADSIVINPHKWLFVPLDASLLLLRDLGTLEGPFRLVPSYLEGGREPRQRLDPMNLGLPLGRRFRALKLWFTLCHLGTDGIASIIRRHLSLARELARRIDSHPAMERLAPVPMSTVCFRARSPDGDADRFNRAWLRSANRSGRLFVSSTRLGDRFVLRLCISGYRTRARDVDDAWNVLRETLGELRSGPASSCHE